MQGALFHVQREKSIAFRTTGGGYPSADIMLLICRHVRPIKKQR